MDTSIIDVYPSKIGSNNKDYQININGNSIFIIIEKNGKNILSKSMNQDDFKINLPHVPNNTLDNRVALIAQENLSSEE